MRPLALLPPALFIAGVALLVASVFTGQGRPILFLVFPGIVAEGLLGLAGVLLVFLGFLAAFAQLWRSALPPDGPVPPAAPPPPAPPPEAPRRRYGGVVLLGPIPIVFGSDRSVALAMVILGIVLTAALLILFLLALL